MKLKVKDGKVQFIMATGDDFVRNEMSVNAANSIIEKGKVTKSTRFEGYPICVDEKFYFAAPVTKRKTKRMTSSEVEPHPIAVTKSRFKEVQND